LIIQIQGNIFSFHNSTQQEKKQAANEFVLNMFFET